ncbi:aquaporin [Mesoplasma seiffertii]|uniref:aquaporin n=1 Tax=Mesoplasma seiffertii TaxID=28224 RepID=UPI00047D5187|nr:aquaporin [Mesoplasma seiffertii]
MQNWHIHFLAEIVGSGLLTLLGGAIMCNIFLKGTNGYKERGLALTISLGWAAAVVVAVTVALLISAGVNGGAHINFAITLMYIVGGWKTYVGSYGLIPVYFFGQIIGFVIGQMLVYALYWVNMKMTIEEGLGVNLLVVHCSIPRVKQKRVTMVNEYLSMAIFLVGFAFMVGTLGNQLIIAKGTSFVFLFILVTAICLAFSGTTAGGINPTKDLTLRVLYQLMPFKNKVKAQWEFAWIPVVFPLLAGTTLGIIIRFFGN